MWTLFSARSYSLLRPGDGEVVCTPIFGLSDKLRNQEWKPPQFLVWSVRRYYKDTATFQARCRQL